jgi:hypothetical protein
MITKIWVLRVLELFFEVFSFHEDTGREFCQLWLDEISWKRRLVRFKAKKFWLNKLKKPFWVFF